MKAIWKWMGTPTAFRTLSLVFFLYLCIAALGRTKSWWETFNGAVLFYSIWSFGYYSAEAKPAQLPEPAEPLMDDKVDAARWRWLSWHIQVAWDEGKFTSLLRMVSDENRRMLNASIDRMMAGDWSDAEKHNAAIKASHGITPPSA
jgi:hypothetical protein